MNRKILALSFAISYFLHKDGKLAKEEYIQIWRKANENLTEKERKDAIKFIAELRGEKNETKKMG